MTDFKIVTMTQADVDKARRRERIATAVLAGLVSNTDREGHIADYARDACRFADALIAELDKEPTNG